MTTSEQAAPSGADSQPLPLKDRIGNIFESIAETEPERPPVAAETSPEPTDQAPDTAEATSGETPTAEEFAEVEYNGNTYQVPPELKEAIIRQSDYTQKTQKLSEERRALEHAQQQVRLQALQAEFAREVGPAVQQLAQIDAAIREKSRVDISMMTQEDLMRVRFELDQLNLAKDELQRTVNARQQQFAENRNKTLQEIQSKATESLKAMIPQWSEATQKAVLEHALAEGYTQEELSDLYDPRYVRTLWKAAQYDRLQQSAKPAIQQAKAVKASPSNPMTAETKKYLAYRKTLAKAPPGSPERTAAVNSRIADIFGR